MARKLLILFLLCLSFAGSAQDPAFSQFFSTPLQLNPAFAGVLSLVGAASGAAAAYSAIKVNQ